MAVEHKDLTGAQLHEPKGCATAPAGTVYEANGSGSGTWVDRTDGIYNLNEYQITTQMTDIGTTSSVYFNVPVKSEIIRLNALLYGALAGTDAILRIYIGGVLFSQTLTIVTAGTAAGQKKSLLITDAHTVPAGTIIEVQTDGGPSSTTRADIQLELIAIE